MHSWRAGGLDVEVRGREVWLRLDRAAQGNRIDLELAQRLCLAVEEIIAEDAADLVVLSSTEAPFCLGVEGAGDWQDVHDWVEAIASLPCPVLAGIAGAAHAEGCELALACDVRIARADATFALPQLGEGRLPRHGATQRLPRLIGLAPASTMILLGEEVSAARAAELGLVASVMSDWDGALERTAASLSRQAPWAARLAKEAVWTSVDVTLAQGLRFEHDSYVLLQTTADRREGIAAFHQRRPPRFRGA